jgi:NADH:ubiquinone oxidoreductase subunit 3 (subunit A)
MTIYILLAIVIAALFYVINLMVYQLSRVNLTQSDLTSTYECGFEPLENQSRTQHSLSYYLIALLYVIFDLEIALVLPALVSFSLLGMTGGVVLLAVMTLLCLAFVYEFELGTFNYVNPLE